MSIIYTPKGKAREYSPLSANVYTGCNHGCLYCYAASLRRTTPDKYGVDAKPRKDVLKILEKECLKNKENPTQVLFNFMHDPYCDFENEFKTTQQALLMFLENRIPVSMLTKGGLRALKDMEIFKKFGKSISIGATLTFDNNKDSLEWEPEAALPESRIEMLRTLKENGIPTWASFEPVIDPEQSIRLIRETINYVDVYKIGKLNRYRGIDKTIDWTLFLTKAARILRDENKPFYVKHDLRIEAPSVKLYGNEVNPDEFVSQPFEKIKERLFDE